MGLRIALAFAVAVANLSSCAAGPAPEREARGSAIVSAREPAVRIEVPREARYVGADRFVLLGIADCELHVFVEADAQHRVQRLYWIQFEGYLPSRPDLHHRYESPRHETVAGMDFYVDTWVSPETPRDFEPDSDVAHLRRLLAANGYTLPRTRSVRLVHLLDDAKRKELMVIYAEALPAPENGFVESALRRVKISKEGS